MRLADRAWRGLFIVAFPVRRWFRRRLGIGRGGAFVAIRSADDLLVVRHSYRPRLDFPGGGLGPDEAPEAAATRELREELGFAVAPGELRRLGIVRRGFGGADDRDHLFELRVGGLPAVRVDNRELVWAGPLSCADAGRRDLDVPVRWYLRRHGPEVLSNLC